MKKLPVQAKLKEIIANIDVSDANYEKASSRYGSLAEYIKNSILADAEPDIYLQGSFKIGTAIKPLTEDGSYDIDIVCNMTKLSKSTQSQYDLKRKVGAVVKDYVKSNHMSNLAVESNRCWTLNYVDDDNFHIDILPSVPCYEKEDDFIAITDRRNLEYHAITKNWETSNPKRYAEWFKESSNFEAYKLAEANRIFASVERVPDYRVKTPLQRIVQILKRHAEIMFENNMEYKPSSIIITTLAAMQYREVSDVSENVFDLMTSVVRNIENGVASREGRPCIYNPVNRDEILSGKWDDDEDYYEEFNRWLHQLKADFNIENLHYSDDIRLSYLERSLFKIKDSEIPQVKMEDISHHQKLKWPFCEREYPKIVAKYLYRKQGFRYRPIKSGLAVNKNGELKFEVKAENIKGYEIHWQVTNTGKEAADAKCLRGGFYESTIVEGKRILTERTLYTGHHYVEAYLIKDGICYGKTIPFEVNIVQGFTSDFIRN